MELFLPGFATLLIAALIVFLILPRLGAPILAALSVVLLAYGVYNHAQLFGYEYRYSTWQDAFKGYASFILIGVMILGILFYISFLFMTKGSSALPASNLPANSGITTAANNLINNAGNVFGNVTGAVTDTVNNVTNTILGNGNTRNSRSNVLSNLTNILATPGSRNNRNNFF
jgi:predicted PurR-regulated permease PerM